MADFHVVMLLMSVFTVNVIAFNHEDLEARLQAAIEQNRAESEARFRELELKLNVKENELEKTRIDLEETKSDLQNTKSEVETLKNSIKYKRVSEPEPIAFHAELDTYIQNLIPNQKIIFKHSPVNLGHAFNNQTGIFTCPQSGVYFFSLSILSYPGDQVETELVVNGDDDGIMVTYSGVSSSQREGSGSKSIVWKLNTGDRVWPRLYNNGIYSGDKLYGDQWSTFTGFLVHAT